jgi:hypothetical protein
VGGSIETAATLPDAARGPRGNAMPYAEGRVFNDADSHFMETKDWLFRYADPKVRSKLAPIDFSVCGGQATEAWSPRCPE